jgi:hypothetical protein
MSKAEDHQYEHCRHIRVIVDELLEMVRTGCMVVYRWGQGRARC